MLAAAALLAGGVLNLAAPQEPAGPGRPLRPLVVLVATLGSFRVFERVP